MNIPHPLKDVLLPALQGTCSAALTLLARARMAVVTDSGTEIGLRARLFKEVLPRNGIGAELGVFKGTLSRYILAVNQPRRLHLVDPWWKYETHWHWAVGDRSTARSFGALVIALEKEIASGQVELHVQDSVGALATFDDGYLDWAYVDSSHAYETPRAELALLRRKVKPDGIIAGDDWRPDPAHRHHGVYKAVQEALAADPSYALVFQEGTQWAIARKP
jgi:SAM-dependent methyltransferase